MTELDGLRIPAAVRPVAEEIVAVTDAVYLQHLDGEYAELCRKLTAKLARKRPCPQLRRQRLANHPLAWLVEIDGIRVDVGALPESLQILADQPRQLPDLPAHGGPGPQGGAR